MTSTMHRQVGQAPSRTATVLIWALCTAGASIWLAAIFVAGHTLRCW
jgi:hypothetical protein